MRAKLLSISAVLLVIVLVACEKDNAGPNIGLELKSINGSSFAKNDQVQFKFKFVPKNDKSLHTLTIARQFTACPFKSVDTTRFNVPAFESTGNGEIEYSFTYGSSIVFSACANSSGQSLKDSVRYSFWLKDADGNVSDTVRTAKLEFLKL